MDSTVQVPWRLEYFLYDYSFLINRDLFIFSLGNLPQPLAEACAHSGCLVNIDCSWFNNVSACRCLTNITLVKPLKTSRSEISCESYVHMNDGLMSLAI